MNHNPYLKSNKSEEVSDNPARGRIEYPENIVNIPWQTRPETPTDYEQELTETLSQIFEADVDDLPGLVSELNRRNVFSPDGTPWTEEKFKLELKDMSV